MATITEQMKKAAAPILEMIYQDPFIQGVIAGDISKEAIRHYLRADSLYLNSFSDIYGLLLAKSTDKQAKQFFLEQIDFLLNQEVTAHLVMAEYVGEPYEDIIRDGAFYPAADHYRKHMFYNAYANSLAETLAAMAPCPWIYLMLARRIMAEHTIDASHPLYGWIHFYTLPFVDDVMHAMDTMIDTAAKTATPELRKRLMQNFVQSCEHERRFFQMAYTQENWLVSV